MKPEIEITAPGLTEEQREIIASELRDYLQPYQQEIVDALLDDALRCVLFGTPRHQ